MAVGQAPQAVEAGIDGDEGLPLQSQADQLDDLGRQVGDVADGLVLDLAALAEGPTEQVSLVRPVLVPPSCGGYVNSRFSLAHARNSKTYRCT